MANDGNGKANQWEGKPMGTHINGEPSQEGTTINEKHNKRGLN